MSRREQIRMTEAESAAFLAAGRTVQLATIDRDGRPHLVAMWYAVVDGRLAMWSYAKSQKVLNLRRDPRLTCLVEAGERYDELRGVQIKGKAVIRDDPETVQQLGEAIWVRYTGPLNESTRPMVEAQARKRLASCVR